MTKRILLVDDNPRDRRLFERGLTGAGFTVSAFSTTGEAGVTVDEVDVLATTDLSSVASTVARWAGQPSQAGGRAAPAMLVLLGVGQRALRATALEAGAEEVLLKPVPIADLIARVETLCKNRERESLRTATLSRGSGRSGDLADLGPADLLAILEEREQSGVLRFEDESGQTGAIFLRKGKPLDAEVGKLFGPEALARLVGWSRGSYRIEIKTVRRADRLSAAADDILVAAAVAAPPEGARSAGASAPAPAAPVAAAPEPARRRAGREADGPVASAASEATAATSTTVTQKAEKPSGARPPPPPAPPDPELLDDGGEAEVADSTGLIDLATMAKEVEEVESPEDPIEARLRALDLERARLPDGAQGISDDNAEAYVAMLPDLPAALDPAASHADGAEGEPEVARAAAGDGALDELANILAEVGLSDGLGDGLGDLGRDGSVAADGGNAVEAELDPIFARQERARDGAAAGGPRRPLPDPEAGDDLGADLRADFGADSRADLPVTNNLTLPLGLAGARNLPSGLEALLAGGQAGIGDDSASLDPDVVAAPRPAGAFDGLPGLTPIAAADAGGAGDATSSSASGPPVGLTRVVPPGPEGASSQAEPPPAWPAWVEDLGMASAGAGAAGAGAAGTEDVVTEEALQALGLGGRRRLARFAVLALGVAGILGVVGIHHAMAKRKTGPATAAGGGRTAGAVAPAAAPSTTSTQAAPPRLALREPPTGASGTPARTGGPAGPTGLTQPTQPNNDGRTHAAPGSPEAASLDRPVSEAEDDENPAKEAPPVPTGSASPAAPAAKTKPAAPAIATSPAPTPPTGADEARGPSGRPGRERQVVADDATLAGTLAACRSRLDRGHPEQAARACREVLAANPDSPDALALLAHAELNQHHLAKAITQAPRAIALEPALAEPYLVLGGALQDSGHSHEAAAAYRAYLARAPHGRYADELRVIVGTM